MYLTKSFSEGICGCVGGQGGGESPSAKWEEKVVGLVMNQSSF